MIASAEPQSASRPGAQICRLAALLLALSGCASADQFGARATAYNREAERVRSQGLLLNIVRAVYRKPLQFSDLTTVTGQATISAGIGAVLPLAGAASTYQLNPTASVSGGPSFTVATLNTKGFYSGILSPIPVRTVASYMQAVYSAKLLLLLLAEEIQFVSGNGAPVTVRTDDILYGKPTVDAVLTELQLAGLSARPVIRRWGRPVPAGDFAHLDAAAKLQSQGLDVTEEQDGHGKPVFQVTQQTDDYTFCFDPAKAKHELAARLSVAFEHVTPALVAQNLCEAKPVPVSGDPKQKLNFRLRSTLGTIYFLGEIARGELGVARGRPPSAPTFTFVGRDELYSDKLFVLSNGAGDPTLTVEYGPATFSIAADPNVSDHSSQVLDLVLQLLALNSDAKDLPNANTVTLIGR